MIVFVSFVFALACIVVFYQILQQFSTGFDWFSGTLYGLIFLVSCGLLYVLLFGIYYWFAGEL